MLTSTRHSHIRGFRFGFQGVVKTLVALDANLRQRKRMAELDAHALNDMGLTRADVRKALRRGAWDAPANWTR